MKAHQSPLTLENFFLLNLDYQVVKPNDDAKVDYSELIDSYEIDIDFAFQQFDSVNFQLFTKIGVNHIEDPKSGYTLFAEGVCVFTFDNNVELTEGDKSQLLHFSGLNICINSLRNILATTTANGPFGRYILPSIDVNHLLKSKQERVKEDKKSD